MVYQVPPSKASAKQNRFEFTLPGSKKVHSVPKIQYLRPRAGRELNDLVAEVEDDRPSQAQAIVIYKWQVALFESYVPGFEDAFEGADQIAELFAAWQNESTATLGESSASAGS